ncbi:MAG: hypothetical protein WAW45_01970 [Atribacterota bacterium]
MVKLNKTRFKNICILIILVATILTLITIFSYIQKQNIDYQKKDKELLIKQQQEEEKLKEENIGEEIEIPELREEIKDQQELEYRDDTVMIF